MKLNISLMILNFKYFGIKFCKFEKIISNSSFVKIMGSIMRDLGIVPDVVCSSPQELCKVIFSKDLKVKIGEELTPTQVQGSPQVGWKAEKSKFYTVTMVDPDAPKREDPVLRDWLHWLVVNIPGNNIGAGEILAEYIGAAPPKGSGLHRYVILVYEQLEKVIFDENKIKSDTTRGREKFRIKKFARKYKLNEPIAGNVFIAQWDKYVDQLYCKLKK